MALCLRQANTRLLNINHILGHGKRLINSSATFDRLLGPKDTDLFKQQPYSHLLNNKFNSEFMKSSGSVAYCNQVSSNNTSSDDRAPEEKLEYIYQSLKQQAPKFFTSNLMDYSFHDKNIIFENRIRGKTYNGLFEYAKQLSYFKIYANYTFAYVKLDVLKITMHPEDSTIKIRWQISGITGYKLLLKMIQFRVWRPQEMIDRHKSPWLDGFSTFYVNRDGFIIRHIADKVMPDEDKRVNPIQKVVDKFGGIPKLALFVNLSTNVTPIIT